MGKYLRVEHVDEFHVRFYSGQQECYIAQNGENFVCYNGESGFGGIPAGAGRWVSKDAGKVKEYWDRPAQRKKCPIQISNIEVVAADPRCGGCGKKDCIYCNHLIFR